VPEHVPCVCVVYQGRGIADGDSFSFNEEFTSKLKRIKVPLVSMKDASQEEVAAPADAVPAPVEEDRRH
jgi:cullin 3